MQQVLVEATRRLSPEEHSVTVPEMIGRVLEGVVEQPVRTFIDWYLPADPNLYGRSKVVRFATELGNTTPQLVDKIVVPAVGYSVVFEDITVLDTTDARSLLIIAEMQNGDKPVPALSKARRTFVAPLEPGCSVAVSLDAVTGLAPEYGDRFMKIVYSLPEPLNGQLQQIFQQTQVEGRLEEGSHGPFWQAGSGLQQLVQNLLRHDPQVESYRQMLTFTHEALELSRAAHPVYTQREPAPPATVRTNSISWMDRQ